MDSKTFRLAVVSMVSILLLVALIVYAANMDRFGKLFDKKTDTSPAETVTETAEVTEGEFGEQIGDDLKAFITDPDFFDGDNRSESVVITTDNKPPAYPIVDEALQGYSAEGESTDAAGTPGQTAGAGASDSSSGESSASSSDSSAGANSASTSDSAKSSQEQPAGAGKEASGGQAGN